MEQNLESETERERRAFDSQCPATLNAAPLSLPPERCLLGWREEPKKDVVVVVVVGGGGGGMEQRRAIQT